MVEEGFERNRYRAAPECPCGKSNKDGKFAPFKGETKYGKCFSCGEKFLRPLEKDEYKSSKQKFVDPEIMKATITNRIKGNNLFKHFEQKFSASVAEQIFRDNYIGITKDGGTIFWLVDSRGRVCQPKIVHYKEDGHRDQNIQIKVHPEYSGAKGYYPTCTFGEHALIEDKVIMMVESEKTAAIAGHVFPEYTWLATGGSTGLSAEKAFALSGKTVVVLPDADMAGREAAGSTAGVLRKNECAVIVEDLFLDQMKGYDIADFIADNGEEAYDEMRNILHQAVAKASGEKVHDYDKGIFRIMDHFEDIYIDHFRNGKPRGTSTGFEELDDIIKWMHSRLFVWTGYPNSGKALSIDTKIPTRHGFVRMGDIQIGDHVFNKDGEQVRVVGVSDIRDDRKMYRVHFSGGHYLDACEDHRWLIHTDAAASSLIRRMKNPGGRKLRGSDQSDNWVQPEVMTTKEMLSDFRTSDGKYNRRVIVNQSIDVGEQRLPIDPYVLGCWLGDGSNYDGKFTSADLEIVNEIRERGYKVSDYEADYAFYISGIKADLRGLNLIQNKHVPELYIFGASVDQRMDLLRGLMDTDGYISVGGVCEYTTVDEKLARSVVSLISSLGIKCSILKNESKLYGVKKKDRYRIAFKTNKEVFGLDRKAERIDDRRNPRHMFRSVVKIEEIANVPSRCISVDSPCKTYLAGEAMIVTHNTEFLLYLSLLATVKHDAKWYMFVPESMSSEQEGVLTVEEVFDTLAYMYVGKSPDPESYHGQMTEEEYREAAAFINEHFIFVYPNEGMATLTDVLDHFEHLIKTEGTPFGVIIDPWNNLVSEQKDGELLDQHEMAQLMRLKTFAVVHHLIFNVVAHPSSQRPSTDGDIAPASAFTIRGGAPWNNKPDGVFSVHRPNWHKESVVESNAGNGYKPVEVNGKNSTVVEIHNHKMKNQKVMTANPGVVTIDFDRVTNRYVNSRWISPLDQERYALGMHRPKRDIELEEKQQDIPF